MSDALRITGIASGIDTDSTVKKLIQSEQFKVDRAKQEKQFLEWQKEDYREVANILRGFQDSYLDVLSPTTNLMSTSSFSLFAGSSSDSTSIEIETTSNSIAGDITINSVTQLATKDTYRSATETIGNLTSGVMSDIGSLNTLIDTDNTMNFTFDGVTKSILLDQNDYASHDALAADLTAKLQDEFTNVDITVTNTGGQLEFSIYQAGTTTEETGHALTIESGNDDLLTAMSLRSGQSNTVNTSSTLADVFGRSGDTALTINGVSFTFEETDTISDVMNEINASNANVILSYDNFTDGFELTSTLVGTDSTIEITDTDSLFVDFKLQGAESTYEAAQNAIFQANGVTTTRSDNTFIINGSNITLKGVTTEAVTIDITSDTKDTKDMIAKFVLDYNKMISTINEKVSSKKNNDFPPLTEDQKEGMSDDDIEKWQAKAREGTLSGDSTTRDITRALRNAFSATIDGLGISLYDIGITTSNDYRDRGKLVIDEDRLDAALKDRPNEVIELFTKTSSTDYSDTANRGLRNSENGLAARLSDILKDNIRTTRNTAGEKGYLIEKAGNATGVDASSDFAMKIKDMDKKIADLLIMLGKKEETYYNQFARMETALQRMNDQSSWISSQMGG